MVFWQTGPDPLHLQSGKHTSQNRQRMPSEGSKNRTSPSPSSRQLQASMNPPSSSRALAPNGVTVSSRPSEASKQSYTKQHSPVGGKSCLVLPHFGGGKKKKTKRALRVSSSAASTADQSSTADPFQTNRNNDQQSLLKQANSLSISGREWFLESLQEEGGEGLYDQDRPAAFSLGHASQIGGASSSAAGSSAAAVHGEFVTPTKMSTHEGHVSETPSTTSSTEPSSSLLHFPSPQDRSHDARRRRHRSSGQMHAYTGELEPEGFRGQEATAATAGPGRAPGSEELPLRSFLVSSSSERSASRSQRSVASGGRRREAAEEPSVPRPEGSQRHVLQQQQRQQQLLDHLQEQERQETLQLQQQQQQQQDESQRASPPRTPPGMPPSPNDSSRQSNGSSNSMDHDRIVASNVAEISRQEQQQQQQQQQQQREPSSNQQPHSLDAIHREEDDLHAVPFKNPNSPEAEAHQHVGDFEGSPAAFRRSAPVNVDDSQFEDPLEHVQGIHGMAMEHVMRGEYDMALQAFSQVLRVYLEQHGRAHPLTASAYHNLGTVHTKRAGLLVDHTLHQRHCREQALLCFQAAARSARDCPQLGPSHPNVAVSLVRIGFLLLQSRQYQNAVITFEEALRIRLDQYGPTHGLVANLYNNLGVCHMHLQNFSVGRRYLQQALDIQKELLNQENYSTTALLELADTLCNIGGLNLEWIRQQGPDVRHALDAESSFLEALELRSKVLGDQHPLTNQVRSLHDMVRSIPLPKGMTNKVHKPAYPEEYSPATVSDMTFRSTTDSTVKSPKSPSPYTRGTMQRRSETVLQPPLSTTERLNLPSLDKPISENSSPDRSIRSQYSLQKEQTAASQSRHSMAATRMTSPIEGSECRSIVEKTLVSTDKMASYDTTEESCLLKRPGDEQSSQLGLVVTYAQSTATESTKKESDRMSTLRHAKAILEAHRDLLNSPERPSGGEKPSDVPTTRSTSNEKSVPHEDGLVPLSGDWPSPTTERISAEVLQNPTQHLHTIQNGATSYMRRGRHMEAVQLLEMVVECQKAKNGPLHKDVGDALHNVGIAYLRMDEHYKALSSFEEAVRVRKGALGRDHPQVAESLVKVGISLLLLQRLEDSLWIFREALSVRKHALGALHPSNARIYNNIGCVHVEFNELKEARRAFEAALDIQRNSLISDPDSGPIIFGASTTLQNLAYLYSKRDMHEKAAMVLRESLSLQEKVMDPEHPSVLGTLESLGDACLDARRFSHALKYFNELFDRSQTSQPLSKLKQAMILHKIAVIYEHQDDPKAQIAKLEMALHFLRSDTSDGMMEERKALDKKVRQELLSVREELEKSEDNWV